ncbi:hypothetical protein [Bradyrhizobium sp. BRP56]|uniref:hypothetical protein n=1 Tax=Bradyrhizobium sp. BRP56 TaxID=2793819 RepID=UPI001CD7F92C|nr:hypothetical protein [Bradyrhizobium sp. BRP56]MCA1397938.1 hypothetical protein [Bradyrhizobium sp. BRP56]
MMSLLVLVAFMSTNSDAQDQNARSIMLNHVKQAEAQMKAEFGPKVFLGRAELDGPHGHETIGQAWARVLIAAGAPATVRGREELAKKAGLDPQASMAYAAPLANLDAIEYLETELEKAH